MQKYWFIVLIGLAAGCRTTCHNSCCTNPDKNPAAFAPRAAARPMPAPAPDDVSPGMIYFREERENLWRARDRRYISNDQYADLLEKLQGDMRQIIMEEEEHNSAPFQPMPMPMRPPFRRDKPMRPRPGE